VEEHNSTHRGAHVVDPSEELIGVTNVFLRWYKLLTSTFCEPSLIGTFVL
jgi:hypothetical protein